MVSRVRQVLCAAPLLACVKPAMAWADEGERPVSADAGGVISPFAFILTTPTSLIFRASGPSDTVGAYIDSIGLVGAPVPEPAAWAMLILGVGLVGGAMRRRRNTTVRYAF